MKNEIKNIYNDTIRLFVKKDGIERQVDLPPGQSMVIDDYETKTMRVFKKRGFIRVNQVSMTEEVHKTMDNFTDSNNDEPMDHFHTTEDHKAIEPLKVDEDLSGMQNSESLDASPTAFEIIENEVEQYIEEGYIKGEWTDEDIDFLKKNYSSKGRKYCSTHLNRNESSVQKKINSLGLKKKKKKK